MNINEESILNLVLPNPSETTPIWNSSNPNVCTVKSDDGYTAKVVAVGKGKADIVARTNCDFGSGVREHNTVFPIEVEGEDAPVEQEVIVATEEKPLRYWIEKS